MPNSTSVTKYVCAIHKLCPVITHPEPGQINPPYKIMKLRTDEQNVMRKEIYLCTSKNNLARHKNEQYNLGLLHSIDQSWKQLRFILQTTTDSQE
jgi:hypothetical protein